MTIVAGIYSRHNDCLISDKIYIELKQLISRNPNDKVIEFKDKRCVLMKVDIGAYQEPAIKHDSNGSVTMLVGDPHLVDGHDRVSQTRSYDIDILHRSWSKDKYDILTKTQGVFCGAHYQVSSKKLTLVADKLCIRPMYYWIGGKYVVFASALRILERFTLVPKIMDLQAITELVGLGYPLGIRTPYANISLLKAAEILQVSENSLCRSQYWRWDEIEQLDSSQEVQMKEAYSLFGDAIRRRVKNDTSTVSFLSGGLDSRIIVAVLRDLNVKVHSFTFSLSKQQDAVFGEQFAKKAGTFHTQKYTDIRTSDIDRTLPMRMADALYKLDSSIIDSIDRPKIAWSGDGGSVGVGYVYMNREIVELMRGDRYIHAIENYMDSIGGPITKALFRKNYASLITGFSKRGILEEFDNIHCPDQARLFHIFLLLNDQRRHLSRHYEDIDLYRYEYHLPFFDGDFLSYILKCSVDSFLYHRFYTKWLDYFPSVVKSVPWQAYPGHEPCPLPIPEGLRYQFQPEHFKDLQEQQKKQRIKFATDLLRAKDFPSDIISKKRFRLATMAYRTGIKNYGYVMNTANIFYKYWQICQGKYTLQ